MVGQQQPDGLEARATRCIHELQALKKRAEDARRYHRTTPTKDLLIQITRVVDDHKGSLQAWSTALSKQGHTADPDVVNTVARLLDSLDHSISSASDRLESRLRHRRLYLLGFFKSKRRVLPSRIASLFSWLSRDRLGSRLEGDLTDVGKKIGDLQGQNKILLVGRAEEAGRQSKKRNLPDRSIQPYDAFLQLFENARPETATDMRSAALDLLWDQLPRCTELDGKVGNVEDPGDGLLYNEELVTKARSVLDDLHKAWSAKPDMPTFPHELRDMAKICLVLRGMRQKALLKDFLDNKIVDRHLPMERSRVEEILRMDHAEYTSLFYAEQHRVVPRIWDEGQHLEIEEEEPLPLVGERMLNSGSYGAVMLVRDPFSSARYARKQQLTSAEEHLNNAARKHLEDETKRLKDLRHRHVIHLVKSYRRGRAWGILLRPAAHTDLERLILRYHENKFDTVRNCKHRDWIRPVFMNAFGCLSKGLAYIHGRDIRHRDVKPGNILYIGKVDQDPQRLLWADFGLAYDFHETGNSKTRSHKVYSKRYAAPEIVAQRTKSAHSPTTSVPSNLDRILEGKVVDAPIESEFREEGANDHGRKTDIFALGCIFLELLACLLEEKLPIDQRVPRASPEGQTSLPREVQMFSQNIRELRAWASERHSSGANSNLNPLLAIAARMISSEPEERPVISEVVQSLVNSGRPFFCDICWQDCQKDQNIKLSDGSAQPTAPESPPSSPGGSLPQKLLNRVNSGPAGNVLKRVGSGFRPQSKVASPRPPGDNYRRHMSVG